MGDRPGNRIVAHSGGRLDAVSDDWVRNEVEDFAVSVIEAITRSLSQGRLDKTL